MRCDRVALGSAPPTCSRTRTLVLRSASVRLTPLIAPSRSARAPSRRAPSFIAMTVAPAAGRPASRCPGLRARRAPSSRAPGPDEHTFGARVFLRRHPVAVRSTSARHAACPASSLARMRRQPARPSAACISAFRSSSLTSPPICSVPTPACRRRRPCRAEKVDTLVCPASLHPRPARGLDARSMLAAKLALAIEVQRRDLHRDVEPSSCAVKTNRQRGRSRTPSSRVELARQLRRCLDLRCDASPRSSPAGLRSTENSAAIALVRRPGWHAELEARSPSRAG